MLELIEKDYKSFIYTHIPKCGGTSFRNYINEAAIRNNININKIYIPGYNKVANHKNIPQLSKQELEILQKQEIKILANHAKFDVERVYQLNMRNPFMYTIFREPVARFISHYNFFYYKNGYEECGGLTLDELPHEKLEYLIKMLSNIHVRYLSNIKHVKIVGFENMTKLAKYNLMYVYGSFGILEEMELSIKVLQQATPNWLIFDGKFPFLNTDKTKSKQKVSKEVIELIRKHNLYDIELYNFALDLLFRQGKDILKRNDVNNVLSQ